VTFVDCVFANQNVHISFRGHEICEVLFEL